MEYTKKKNWIIAIAVAIVYLTISILFDVPVFFFEFISGACDVTTQVRVVERPEERSG